MRIDGDVSMKRRVLALIVPLMFVGGVVGGCAAGRFGNDPTDVEPTATCTHPTPTSFECDILVPTTVKLNTSP